MRLPTCAYRLATWCSLAILILSLPASHWTASAQDFLAERGSLPAPTFPTNNGTNKSVPLTVMAVGGSSAQGYYDPHLNGYLARALKIVSSSLHRPIRFVNKAKSGDIPTKFAPEYGPMVHEVHPDIVIISWGLLNSIAKKVPEEMFQQTIQSEVTMALKEGADVWIVTPLVTEATYVGPEASLEPTYAQLEIAGALAVHSPYVHIFDLLGTMEQYLRQHHMSIQPYVHNLWHLDRAGHILAGRILANMILQQANAVGLPITGPAIPWDWRHQRS